jgi:hypothetical protein
MSGCGSCSQGANYFSFGKLSRGRSPKKSKGKPAKRSPKRSPKRSIRIYKRRSPKRSPKRRSPKRKVVKDKKNKKIGTRLSARTVYDEQGRKSLGKSFRILQKDGKYKMKVLSLRRDGIPYFSNKFGNTDTSVKSKPIRFNKHSNYDKVLNLKIPYNNNWLRGPSYDNMTGILNSWPNNNMYIAPGGVQQPYTMSVLPRMAPRISRGNNFGIKHSHFGQMCFGG